MGKTYQNTTGSNQIFKELSSNYKIESVFLNPNQPDERSNPPPPTHTHTHTLLHSKKKNEKQRKKERISKQKLLKHCHQGQNDIVSAILERLEFKNVSCRPTMVASNTFQYYMAPSL